MCAMTHAYFTTYTDQSGSVDISFWNKVILVTIEGTEFMCDQ